MSSSQRKLCQDKCSPLFIRRSSSKWQLGRGWCSHECRWHTTKSLMNAISKHSVKEPVILEIPNGFDFISCVVQFAQHFRISVTLLTSQGHIFLGLTVVLMLLLDTLLVVFMFNLQMLQGNIMRGRIVSHESSKCRFRFYKY